MQELIGRRAELDRALERLESGQGIAIVGDAGVGCSRLLAELAEGAEEAGYTVHSIVATKATSTVPFAALAPLLPSRSIPDRTDFLYAVRSALLEHPAGRRVLIAVDDAHHLDDGSLAVLATLLDAPDAVIAVTMERSAAAPEGLTVLLGEARLARIHLDPLDQAATRQLVEEILGPAEPALGNELWRLGRGNPLLIEEMINGARAAGTVQRRDGIWCLAGSLIDNPRLGDLVRERIDRLPEGDRQALEHVAIGAPLPLGVAEAAITSEMVSRLEDRHLTEAFEVEALDMVQPRHPLHGDILRAHVGRSRHRRVLQNLIDAARTCGYPRGADELRTALWQREVGLEPEPDLVVAGALIALARHEPGLAAALATTAWESARTAAVGTVVGRALSLQGKTEEAEDVLAIAAAMPTKEPGELASVRAHNLGFGLGRVGDAVEVLEAATATTTDDGMRGRLDAERAMFEAMRGGLRKTEEASLAALENAAAPSRNRASAYVTLSLARSMMADCTGFLEVLPDALEEVSSLSPGEPMFLDQIMSLHACTRLGTGELERAVEITEGRLSVIGDDDPAGPMWLYQRAMVADLRGRLEEAHQAAVDALAAHEVTDPLRTRLIALGIAGLVEGQLGRRLDDKDLHTTPIELEPRLGAWIARGRAWGLAAAGEPHQGAVLVAQAGELSIDAEHVLVGAWTAHDAVRLGRPERALDALERADQEAHGAALLSVMLDHAATASAADARGRLEVAGRFAAAGAMLLAAEAAAGAAATWEDTGNTVEAQRAAAVAALWLEHCYGAATPLVRSSPAGLTRRQLQVARLAAGGASSAEIADDLYVSVRTVDNHLRRIYRKLGLEGRHELAEVLARAIEPVKQAGPDN